MLRARCSALRRDQELPSAVRGPGGGQRLGLAGALLGLWATLALAVFLIEAAVPIGLTRWILGKDDFGEATAVAAGIAVIGPIVLALACSFVIAGLAIAF